MSELPNCSITSIEKNNQLGQQKKVLVSGGAGFLGSNLCRWLVNAGSYVCCLDNLITSDLRSIKLLKSHEHFEFIEGDVTDPNIFSLLDNSQFDEIYHLACPTGVPNIDVYGEEMLQTCSTGTSNILRFARRHGAKLLYTSSAEAYGDPQLFPQAEDYNGNVDPIGPRSPYEEGKRFSEALVALYAKKHKLDAKIVRIFNTFGPGMSRNDTRVIPHFLRKISDGKKIIIYGDGSQTRTHLYVDDNIAALQLVMEKGDPGEVYNIGGEKQLSVVELAKIIEGLTPMDVKVELQPHFIEDHGGRQPSISKVKQLGWKPSVDITRGLKQMLVSFGIPLTTVNSNSNSKRRIEANSELELAE